MASTICVYGEQERVNLVVQAVQLNNLLLDALGSNGRYGRTDQALTIGEGRMAYLDDADFRYLGKPINTEFSEVDCRRLLKEKIHSPLEALDTNTLTASAKIWLCHHFVTSKLSWPLLNNDLSLSFVKSCKPLPPNHSSGGSCFQSAPTLQSFLLVAAISVV